MFTEDGMLVADREEIETTGTGVRWSVRGIEWDSEEQCSG